MAGIVTVSVSPRNCGHRNVTIRLDGVDYVFNDWHDSDLNVALTTDETRELLLLSARYLRGKGVTLANFLNRVVHGDEATNVKAYNLVAPGSVITKTNIGAAYVNVCPGANGERVLVDFTGCTQFRLILTCNLIGTGAFGARVVRDADSVVLFENTNLGAAGERELDTDWQSLPGTFSGLTLLRLQMKSTTAADDPIVRRCQVLAQ